MCVRGCVCVCFPVCTVLLHFHSRLQYFQLISFYKARPLHNYPLSIRSHPVPHCRLKPMLINHWSPEVAPSRWCHSHHGSGWLESQKKVVCHHKRQRGGREFLTWSLIWEKSGMRWCVLMSSGLKMSRFWHRVIFPSSFSWFMQKDIWT